MTNSSSLNTHELNQSNAAYYRAYSKNENKQLWFYFGIAPLAVLSGWSLVAFALTGNWVWEFPMALMFSLIGSLTALVSTRLSKTGL